MHSANYKIRRYFGREANCCCFLSSSCSKTFKASASTQLSTFLWWNQAIMEQEQKMLNENHFATLNSFTFTETIESRPFPMNLNSHLKSMISIIFMLVLALGLKSRLKIFKYLASDEAQMKPINVLISLQQLNGLLQGISTIFKVAAFNLRTPLSALLGANFCQWVDLPANVYLVGK